MKYFLINTDSRKDLVDVVNQYIKQGWKLRSKTIVVRIAGSYFNYFQEVVKDEEESRSQAT
jgi:transposase